MSEARDAMPHALSGERCQVDDPSAGRVSYYVDGPQALDTSKADSTRPLLLIHSVNAAASAHEVRPLFDHFKTTRTTIAIDLPGYGHSERSDRTYDQQLMVDAVRAVVADIRSRFSPEHNDRAIDALAVSLSCEFLARAAREVPSSFHSLALVSPTGLTRRSSPKGPPEANRGKPAVLGFLQLPFIGRGLYRALTSRLSVRFFLRKTFGRKDINDELFETSWRVTNYPNAQRAPFHFLSGFLFSADILSVYLELDHPVWLSHGVRGDFTDYSKSSTVSERANWSKTVFQTGALPYFEIPEEFIGAYESFLAPIA